MSEFDDTLDRDEVFLTGTVDGRDTDVRFAIMCHGVELRDGIVVGVIPLEGCRYAGRVIVRDGRKAVSMLFDDKNTPGWPR